MQVLTAAVLLAAIRRPLPARSLVGGWVVPVRAQIPSPSAAAHFLIYAGPIGGVLAIKTLVYGDVHTHAPVSSVVGMTGSNFYLTPHASRMSLDECANGFQIQSDVL